MNQHINDWLEESKKRADTEIDNLVEVLGNGNEQLDNLATYVLERLLKLTSVDSKLPSSFGQPQCNFISPDQHSDESDAHLLNCLGLAGLDLQDIPHRWYKNKFFDRIVMCPREASFAAFSERAIWCAWRQFCNHCHNRFSAVLLELERKNTSYADSIRLIKHLHLVLELVNRNPKRNLLLMDRLPNSKQELNTILTKWIQYYEENCVETPQPFHDLKKELEQDLNWTDFLNSRVNRILDKLLSPDEPKWTLLHNRILQIKGAVLVWSELYRKFQKEWDSSSSFNDSFDELHLIGLVIRIDQHMEKEKWHGKNIIVSAEEVHVDGYFTWDVSGVDGTSPCKQVKAADGKDPGQDGSPGKNGLPGESGGHVYVSCVKLVNGRRWTVRSEGGRGGPGQVGGDGRDGTNGKKNLKSGMWYDIANGKAPEQQAEMNYKELISSDDFSDHPTFEKHYEALKENLGKIPGGGVNYIHDYPPNDGWYYLECKRKSDGGQIIVCCHEKRSKKVLRCPRKRHRLVLLQGSLKGTEGQKGGCGGNGGNGGQGGYRGSVLIRSMLDGRMLDIHPNSTAQASFLGEAVARAADGLSGNSGKPGRDGKHGERFPDAGFISKEYSEPCKVISKLDIVLSDNEALNVIFTPEKLKTRAINFVRCGLIEGWKKCYATINSANPLSFSVKQKNAKTLVSTTEKACKRSIDKMSFTQYETDIRYWMLWAKFIGGTNYANQQMTMFDTAVAMVSAQLYHASTYSNQIEVARCVRSTSFWNRRNTNYESLYHPESNLLQQDTSIELKKSCNCPAISSEILDVCNKLIAVLRNQEQEERKHHPAIAKLSYMYDPTQVLLSGRNSNLATFKLRKIKKEESMESLRSYYERLQENFIQRIVISSSVIDDKKLHLHSTYNMYSLFFSNESQQSKLTFPLDLWKEFADPTNHKLRRLIDADIVSEKGDESARKSITEMERWRKLIEVATVGRQNIGKEWVRAVMSCTPNLWLVLLNCLLPESSLPENFSFRDEWTEELENKHRKILAHPFRAIGLAELETLSLDTCMKFEVNVNNQAANDEELLTSSGQIVNKSLPARSCIGVGSESTSIRLNIEGHSKWCSTSGSSTFSRLRETETQLIHQIESEFSQERGTTVIEGLRELLIASNENSTEATQWIKLLDPMNGLPNWLSWLIWMRMQHVSNLSTDKQFKTDGMIALIQRVIEWMHDEEDMLTVSSIAAFSCPHVWPYELLLAETIHKLKMLLLRTSSPRLDDKLRKRQCDVLDSWMKMLKKLDINVLRALRDSCLLLVTQRHDVACNNEASSPIFCMPENEITCILETLTHDEYGKLDGDQLNRLANIKLNHWLPVLKFTFWTKVVKKFIITPDERQKALYTILEIDMKNGSGWCNQEILTNVFTAEGAAPKNNQVNHLKTLQAYLWNNEDNQGDDNLQERPLQEIVNLTKESADKIKLQTRDDDNFTFWDEIKKKTEKNNNLNIAGSWEEVKIKVSTLIAKMKGENEITDNGSIPKDFIPKGKEVQRSETKLNFKLGLDEFLPVFEGVVEQYKGFRLRETQRFVVTLIVNFHEKTQKQKGNKKTSQKANAGNIFLEVGTGEGKSLIFAALAIYWALHGRTIDIVTVNSILAKRDSELSTRDGGLREIYEAFGITVSNNCNAQEERRSMAYKAKVVYGELADFQRDYLLDLFLNKNIRGDREYNQMMIDEVDSLLLDRGNNVLYLSHDIPGMETLEALYVCIWHKVSTSTHDANPSVIKAHILYDLFGTITKTDLVKLVRREKTAKWSDNKVKLKIVNSLWLELIVIGVIDSAGKFLVQNFNQLNQMLSHLPDDHKDLIPRLVYFFQHVANRSRNFNIPSFLLPFVEQNLDEWICNAKRALVLERDVDYVVDYDPAVSDFQVNPVVTIVDLDTGTDQATAQWDAALHQFVQLKEGCQLSLQRLKAVFISNKSYIKMHNLIGLSGTFGSAFESSYLKETYNADIFKIPTALPRKLSFLSPPIVKNNQSDWLSAIEQQTLNVIKNSRSVLIICRSIREVDLVYNNFLKNDGMQGRLFCFKRDFHEFRFERKHLDPGLIIVATCLAGRGTDIKLSDELRNNGGLHVCLTFLPNNLRTEEQVFGRAGRNGARGSCSFIIQLDTNKLPSLELPAMYKEEDAWSRFTLAKIHRIHLEHQEWEQHPKHKIQSDIERVLLRKFSSTYESLRKVCLQRNYQPVERDVYCKSALDQWALWINTFDNEEAQTVNPIIDPEYEVPLVFEDFSFKLNEFISSNDPCTQSCPSWVTPSRRIQLAKYWISAGDKRKLKAASTILDELITSPDAIYYPSSHYYKAYWIVNSGRLNEETENFIRHLRCAEGILKEQIEAQISLAGIAMLCWNSNNGKHANGDKLYLTPYQVQKQNVVKLLEMHLSSISTMLGNWCTPKLLSQAYGKKDSKTRLSDGSYILERLCQENIILKYRVDSSKLNEKHIIRKLSFSYGIDSEELFNFLAELATSASEEDIYRSLRTRNLFKGRTRESFWKHLCGKGILEEPTDVLMISEEEWKTQGKPAENDARALTDQDLSSFLFRDRTLLKQPKDKSIRAFKKSAIRNFYEKDSNNYRAMRICFQLNKTANSVCYNKLVSSRQAKHIASNCNTPVVLECEDLKRLGIPQVDSENIFQSLVNQDIIDKGGNPRKIQTVFKYPDCPFYESDVSRLLNHVFIAEKICLEWENCLEGHKSNPKESNEILSGSLELLPLHPDYALIAELIALGLIIPPSITDKDKIDFDRDGSFWDLAIHGFEPTLLQKMFSNNQANIDGKVLQELGRILNRNRPAYVGLKKSKAALSPLAEKFPKNEIIAGLANELHAFRLIGFDDFFELYDGSRLAGFQRWSIVLGITSIAKIAITILCICGVIPPILGLKMNPKDILADIFDMAYFLRCFTNRRPTFADYVADHEKNNSIIKIIQGIHNVCFGKFSSVNQDDEGSDGNSVASRVSHKREGHIFSGYANKVTRFPAELSSALASESFQLQPRKEKRMSMIKFARDLLADEKDNLISKICEMLDQQKPHIEKRLGALFTKVKRPAQANEILDDVTRFVFTDLNFLSYKSIFVDFAWYEEESATISSSILHLLTDETENLKVTIQRTIEEKIIKDILNRLKDLLNSWCTFIQSSPISNTKYDNYDNYDTHQNARDTRTILAELEDAITKPAGYYFSCWAEQLLQDIEIREIQAKNDALYTSESASDENLNAFVSSSGEQYDKFRTRNTVQRVAHINRPPFLKSCLSLLKKTSNPAILALILEDDQVKIPADRFIVDAFACIFPAALESFGISGQKCAIRIELSSTGECFHQTHSHLKNDSNGASSNVYVVAADRVAIDRSLKQFVEAFAPFKVCNEIESDENLGKNYDCLINCLADQINVIHKLYKPTDQIRKELRTNLASNILGNASLITDAWNEYLFYYRFSGFKKVTD